MQLVLSNNRVITYGENFLVTGDNVINTETGEKYENATVAECENCPSDIDKVGYEYHAGVFVPLNDNKFVKISSVTFCHTGVVANGTTIDIPITADELLKYSTIRFGIKKGSKINTEGKPGLLYVGGYSGIKIIDICTDNEVRVFEDDFIIEKALHVGVRQYQLTKTSEADELVRGPNLFDTGYAEYAQPQLYFHVNNTTSQTLFVDMVVEVYGKVV